MSIDLTCRSERQIDRAEIIADETTDAERDSSAYRGIGCCRFKIPRTISDRTKAPLAVLLQKSEVEIEIVGLPDADRIGRRDADADIGRRNPFTGDIADCAMLLERPTAGRVG